MVLRFLRQWCDILTTNEKETTERTYERNISIKQNPKQTTQSQQDSNCNYTLNFILIQFEPCWVISSLIYFYYFELDNGAMTTPKRCSVLSFIFTCLINSISKRNNRHHHHDFHDHMYLDKRTGPS